jgi:GPH family glycoside/pentoside/hexuronide:cation symporter
VGKKRAFIILMAVSTISTAAFFFCEPHQVLLMFTLNALGSFTGGPLSPLLWAMYADAADYGEWKTGRRATGLVFSASTMSQKFGWAIGSAVALSLLGATGFQANVAQSPNVLTMLRLLMSVVPAGFGIVCIVLMLVYRLDAETMKTIQGELAARHREAALE